MSSSSPQRSRSQNSSASNSSSTSPPSSSDHHTALCSAYSPAAKATEDWTTIEDRTERRRIQNRIAQRAYRQKLKERLITLERKAASSSSSNSPGPEEVYARPQSHTMHSQPIEDDKFKQTWSVSPEISEFHFDEGIHMPPYMNANSNMAFETIPEEQYYSQPQNHPQGLAYAPFESMYPDFDSLADQGSAYGPFSYPDMPFDTFLRS